ncbi:hypothetical protein ACWCWD_05010 [Streptomyces sp. NPDC001493]
MSATKLLLSAVTAALLASASACSASSAPDTPTSTTTAAATTATADAEPSRSANAGVAAALVPDVTGGNAGRAYEQMSATMDMTFKDASGQGRPVDDPASWKICGSQPGPNQPVADGPVVFDVVMVSENCPNTTP